MSPFSSDSVATQPRGLPTSSSSSICLASLLAVVVFRRNRRSDYRHAALFTYVGLRRAAYGGWGAYIARPG
jgi:hypothetical protein